MTLAPSPPSTAPFFLKTNLLLIWVGLLSLGACHGSEDHTGRLFDFTSYDIASAFSLKWAEGDTVWIRRYHEFKGLGSAQGEYYFLLSKEEKKRCDSLLNTIDYHALDSAWAVSETVDGWHYTVYTKLPDGREFKHNSSSSRSLDPLMASFVQRYTSAKLRVYGHSNIYQSERYLFRHFGAEHGREDAGKLLPAER